MHDLFDTLLYTQNDSDFLKFENELVRRVYDRIGVCYSNSNNEVAMVTELCNTIDGESYSNKKLGTDFHAQKLHGSRSYVEFCNKDKPTTKELADMIVISVITRGKTILLERTALIQNKKESANGIWNIDQDQLYLLQNFPSFKGKKGLFNGRELAFPNTTQTLGNFGLFMHPGEMVLVNALTVYKLQNNNKISISDICKYTDERFYISNSYSIDWFHGWYLPTQTISHNFYDFIRNWTSFKIGEIVCYKEEPMNYDLCTLNNLVYRKLGLSDLIAKRRFGDNERYEELDANFAMMVFRIDLRD